MPIPNYLKEIVKNESRSGNFTSFDLKCSCGCEKFHIYENYLNKEERALCKPRYDALEYLLTGGKFSGTDRDENGVLHQYVYFTDSYDGPREEVIVPPKPVCAGVNVIKAKCFECGAEYVIYDNRYHGYGGKFYDYSAEREYIPHFCMKKRRDGQPVEIGLSVEHDGSFEEFKEASGISCAYEDYEDAFTWLNIYSIDSDNKKRKLYSFETD
ncbi:MAG: hypothetical protein J6A07_09515 [Firmicutes bacterium]|nr:hypothetical protein [Bacillota bacterium]